MPDKNASWNFLKVNTVIFSVYPDCFVCLFMIWIKCTRKNNCFAGVLTRSTFVDIISERLAQYFVSRGTSHFLRYGPFQCFFSHYWLRLPYLVLHLEKKSLLWLGVNRSFFYACCSTPKIIDKMEKNKKVKGPFKDMAIARLKRLITNSWYQTD